MSKEEKALVIAACMAVCAIIVFPDAAVMLAAGSGYYPYHYFSPTFNTIDFTIYSAVVERIASSGWVFEPQVFEHSANVLPREWLPFLAASPLYMVLGDKWELAIKIIGGALLFIFAWLLIGRWVRGTVYRVLAASAFTLFPTATAFISINPFEFAGNIPAFLSESGLFSARFHSPIATLPFLLLAIYFTLRFFGTGKRKDGIVAGVFCGLLIYVYFFYMVFFFGLVFVLALHLSGKAGSGGYGNYNKPGTPEGQALTKNFLILFGAAFAVSIPYLVVLAMNSAAGISGDLALRAGLGEVSRPYYFLGTLKYLAIAVLGLLLPKKLGLDKILLAGVILGAVIAMNMHLVTGFNIQFIHWQNHVADPASFLLIVSLIPAWKNSELRLRFFPLRGTPNRAVNLAPVAMLVALLLFSVVVQFREANARCSVESVLASPGCGNYTISEGEKDAIVWLKKNSGKDDVLLSLSAQTNARAGADAGLYVYYPNGFITTARNSEIEERMAFAYRFYGVPRKTFEELLTPDEQTMRINFAQDPAKYGADTVLAEKSLIANYPFHFLYTSTLVWQEKKFLDAVSGWPPEVRETLMKNGREGGVFFYPRKVADRLLGIFDKADPQKPGGKITFVLAGKYEKLVGNMKTLEENPSLKKVFRNEEVTIYKYNPS